MSATKLVLLGFGNVGRSFARLLLSKRQELEQVYAINYRVVGIATARHGSALSPSGLDLQAALALADAGKSLASLAQSTTPSDALGFVRASGADVLVENTPVNYDSGQPAVDHIRTALDCGMHVITANKGPVVHGFTELTSLAKQKGRRFYFESAVMDGAPLFSLWRHALPGARLDSFRGILNSTTNLMLTLMEQGQSFQQALAHAQSIGIAETNPSGDTQGWDAAIKAAALVTVLMGVPLKPAQVSRAGIEGLDTRQVQEAQAQGKRWKLVCQAHRNRRGAQASVRPEMVGAIDPLYHIMGTSSAVTFHTDVLGPLTISEQDPGPSATAYGLLADLINALR